MFRSQPIAESARSPGGADRARRRRQILFAGLLGGAAYLVALLLLLPARAVLPADSRSGAVLSVSGRIWDGSARLAGDHAVEWTASPLRSLLRFGLSADWRLDGPDTALQGRVLLRPGMARFSAVEGRAGWALARAFAPGPDLDCDLAARVNVAYLSLGRNPAADGTVKSAPGICRSEKGDTTDIPALTASTEQADGATLISVVTSADAEVARGRLTREGGLSLTLTTAGAALIPGGGPAGPVTIETKL